MRFPYQDELLHFIDNEFEGTPNKIEIIDRLKQHATKAAELVQQTGYHRRDPEVEMGYANLFLAQGDQVKARKHLGKAKQLLDKMRIRMWDFEIRAIEKELG